MDGYLYYMKKLFFSILMLAAIQVAHAQDSPLQLDENNKYVYYQVEEKPAMPADTLYQRALLFAKKADKLQVNADKAANSVGAKGKFIVYANSLASKKDAGEVNYVLTIDAKDQKYRYKFGSFVFVPYKINRYGNMAAVPGIEIPLEKLPSKYGKKDVANYLEQVAAYCKHMAADLKTGMDRALVIKKEETIKKVDTQKW